MTSKSQILGSIGCDVLRVATGYDPNRVLDMIEIMTYTEGEREREIYIYTYTYIIVGKGIFFHMIYITINLTI